MGAELAETTDLSRHAEAYLPGTRGGAAEPWASAERSAKPCGRRLPARGRVPRVPVARAAVLSLLPQAEG